MKSRRKSIAALAISLVSLAPCALAQPNPGQGLAANPPAQNPFMPNMQEWQKMTPEQRREALLKAVDQTVRGALGFMGYNEQPVQDAVATFATEQEKALEPVREKHRKVSQALLNKALSEEQVGVLMDELRIAETEARQKRGEAIAALEAKTNFSKKPRLAVFLSLTGLTGEQTGLIGGVLGNIMTSMMNLQANTPPNVPANPPAVNN